MAFLFVIVRWVAQDPGESQALIASRLPKAPRVTPAPRVTYEPQICGVPVPAPVIGEYRTVYDVYFTVMLC